MTVGELRERMSVEEFLMWTQFDRVHTSEAWEQSALLRLTIAQLVDSKARLEVFLPARVRDRPRQADPFRAFLGWAAQHNARIGAPPP